MAKVTKNVAEPLKGRQPAPKYGGKAKLPFLREYKFPSPAKGFSITRGRKK